MSGQALQNEIRPFTDFRFRQHHNLIAHFRKKLLEPSILGSRFIEAMTSLWVSPIDFRPRWGKENLLAIAVGCDDFLLDRFAGRVLKRRGSINKSPVEKRPTRLRSSRNVIICRDPDRTARKGGHVDPRQGIAIVLKLLLDDPAAGFVHNGETASSKFCQKCRFSASRTSRDQYKLIHSKHRSRRTNPQSTFRKKTVSALR